MARSDFNYTQLGIGDCGHVVGTWPQVAELGGRNPEVICDDCTRAKYALTEDDGVLCVWVQLKESKLAPVSPVKPKRKPPKEKKLSPWQSLLQEEGLF